MGLRAQIPEWSTLVDLYKAGVGLGVLACAGSGVVLQAFGYPVTESALTVAFAAGATVGSMSCAYLSRASRSSA